MSGDRDTSPLGVLVAVLVTATFHAGLVFVIVVAERGTAIALPAPRPKAVKPRGIHGEVAYERRRIESDCSSIPECQPKLEATITVLKVAALGSVEQDPKKLPELQKVEQPEKVEVAVNIDKVNPEPQQKLTFQDFVRKKAQLDKLRRKKVDPFKQVLQDDDDPRKRPTIFEKMVGNLDGDVMGQGSEQDPRDTYMARVSFELMKAFAVPTSIPPEQLKTLVVEVIITEVSPEGGIVGYKLKRKSPVQAFTLSAEATLKQFMASEGGRKRLPPPPPDVLQFVNKRGFVAEFNGKLLSMK